MHAVQATDRLVVELVQHLFVVPLLFRVRAPRLALVAVLVQPRAARRVQVPSLLVEAPAETVVDALSRDAVEEHVVHLGVAGFVGGVAQVEPAPSVWACLQRTQQWLRLSLRLRGFRLCL